MSDRSENQLDQCRERIDEIDDRILELMGERLEVARTIAGIKQALSEPAYYRPEREAQVLSRLRDLKPSLMSEDDVESLFRVIMSITRNSETRLAVALHGPEGTDSEIATRRHFGPAIDIVRMPTVEEVFRSVEAGRTDFAVVPVENSTEEGVSVVMDLLADSPLLVCSEICLPVHHNLITAAPAVADVRKVAAHPQTLSQCRHWLGSQLAEIELVPCSSNAEGVRLAAESPGVAAIAGRDIADAHQLPVLVANIEDDPGNTARFLVLSMRDTPPSGDDKTSFLVAAHNQPDALLQLLKPLADHGVDMNRIESRPFRSGNWEYVFFVDVKGHRDDPSLAGALREIQGEADLFRHLGSYPAAS